MQLQTTNRMRTGFVAMLLISAVLVRLCLAWGTAGASEEQPYSPEQEQKTSLRPRLTEQPATSQMPQADLAVSPNVAVATALVFDDSDVALIQVAGASTYRPDVAQALQSSWRSTSASPPVVLIVHTHGTEGYTAEAGWEYEGAESQRTTDADYSVVRVGRELKQALEELGVTVIHDETMHDEQSFAGAYGASRVAVEGFLQENPEIDLVIDLHRDAAFNPDGSAFAPTVLVDDVSCARLMLVVGTDEGGLTHPDWKKNFSCAVQLQALLQRSVPGLCRDLDLRTERFNQDLSPGALLIEMGAAGNTMPEVLRTAHILAQAVAELLGA